MFNKPKQPKSIGETTEAIVAAFLLSNGLAPSKPIGDNMPYDLIIDHQGQLLRCQVKTGHISPHGCCVFSSRRVRLNMSGCYSKTYSVGEVDMFIAYCYENDKVYFVPNKGNRSMYALRIDPPGGAGNSTIRYAKDFEIGAFMSARWETNGAERLKLGETYMDGNPDPSPKGKE